MASADYLGQIVIEADALLSGFTDQVGMLDAAQAQENATIRLARRRTRFATIADWALGHGSISALHGREVVVDVLGKSSHGHCLR